MSKWLISVPVWGEAYHNIFVKHALPSILAALDGFDHDVRFIIHTDDENQIRKLFKGLNADIRKINRRPTYVTLQESHQDAVNSAEDEERVCLLNADLVISGNLFRACEEHVLKGKKAIVVCGIRTELGKEPTPVGAPPRELLEWAWRNRHQIIRDLEWDSGRSMLPTNLFFQTGPDVVLRGFHLHPVVIEKRQGVTFESTIDGDLLDNFQKHEMHVVTDPDDIAMFEISKPDKRFPIGRPLSPSAVAASMKTRASKLHIWLFTHRIVIQGDGSQCADHSVCKKVLRYLGSH